MTAEHINVTLPDGRTFQGYHARASRANAPGLILIHEWWGLLEETRATARRLAQQGFSTLAIDLYAGKSSLDPAVAGRLMGEVDGAQATAALAAANDWLRGQGARKVGSLGFCFGGTWSMNAALASPIDAAVVFYGWAVRSPEQLAALHGPVMAHFGAKDATVGLDAAAQLKAALQAAGKPGDVYNYLADHAFAREGGPNYEPGAAALAWQRTEAFLRKHLEVAAGVAAYTPPSRQAEFSEIPLLSLSALGAGDDTEASLIDSIRRASEQVGFFYVEDHGVDSALVDSIFEQTRRFFALPEEAREKLHIANSNCFAGYLSVGERGANQGRPRDLLEAYNVTTELPDDDPMVAAGVPLHGKNQWPVGEGDFKRAVLDYYAAMDRLGARLLQAFAMALGLERDSLDAQYRKPLSQLRLLHYPAQTQAVDEMMGARAHRDVGVFTILLQDDVGGLEVCNSAGDWIVAPPIPGTFVINVGEMMKLLTNDRFASALHRVVNRSHRERFSVPYFFNPDFDSVLATLPPFVSDEHPAQFKPIQVGQHIYDFYRNLWPSTAAGKAKA